MNHGDPDALVRVGERSSPAERVIWTLGYSYQGEIARNSLCGRSVWPKNNLEEFRSKLVGITAVQIDHYDYTGALFGRHHYERARSPLTAVMAYC